MREWKNEIMFAKNKFSQRSGEKCLELAIQKAFCVVLPDHVGKCKACEKKCRVWDSRSVDIWTHTKQNEISDLDLGVDLRICGGSFHCVAYSSISLENSIVPRTRTGRVDQFPTRTISQRGRRRKGRQKWNAEESERVMDIARFHEIDKNKT